MVMAGRMDRRITFQTFTESADGAGEPVKTWANLASNPTVWAEVLPLALTNRGGGMEVFDAEQILGLADTRFRIRYRSDITVEMRIVYASVNYDIESVSEIGRREGVDIVARKATA